MKFCWSCVGVLMMLSFASDVASAKFRFRRQEEPATPAPGDAKLCTVCRSKAACNLQDTMDCSKDKLGEGLEDEAAKALFTLIGPDADDPTKYTHCLTVVVGDAELRGCVPGEVCAKIQEGNANATDCKTCVAAAAPCNNAPSGGANGTDTGDKPGGDETTPAGDAASTIALSFAVCFWVFCAAVLY